MYTRSTPEALELKRELENRGVIVESNKWDGHKHIDLTIHRARLNIEVDGKQHYETAHQILSDLARTHYSDFKGYDTIHVPNAFIHNADDLRKVADALARAAYVRSKNFGHRPPYHHYRGNTY